MNNEVENKSRRVRLLDKFCMDEEVMELLELYLIENVADRERVYFHTNAYPEKRDLFSKLLFDLNVRKAGKSSL